MVILSDEELERGAASNAPLVKQRDALGSGKMAITKRAESVQCGVDTFGKRSSPCRAVHYPYSAGPYAYRASVALGLGCLR